MKTLPLTIDDINPTETTFILSAFPGKKFTLDKFHLGHRTFVFAKYGREKMIQVLQEKDVAVIAEIAYRMLKDKETFTTVESFFENICGVRDELSLITAFVGAIGISEPKLDEIRKQMEGEQAHPKKKAPTRRKRIGAKSSTR